MPHTNIKASSKTPSLVVSLDRRDFSASPLDRRDFPVPPIQALFVLFFVCFFFLPALARAGDAELKKGRLELNPDGDGTISASSVDSITVKSDGNVGIGTTRIKIGNSDGYLVSGKDEK